jgi:hypothetical protein
MPPVKPSKVNILKQRIKKISRPAKIMENIIDVFGEAKYIPRPGSYCTYVYYAKTPKLLYDRHPLIAVLELQDWGFKGFNFHLNMHRNYNWTEVASLFCPIENSEISYFQNINYRVLVRNP